MPQQLRHLLSLKTVLGGVTVRHSTLCILSVEVNFVYRWLGLCIGIHGSYVDIDGLWVILILRLCLGDANCSNLTDDSAAHISEETTNAERAAPLAIMVSVIATATLGWLLLIATSFAIPSVDDILSSRLPLFMGQVFLNVLGKHGMLAIWSLIIVVQVRTLDLLPEKGV